VRLKLSVAAPELPPLPAAVEVAAYRIAVEALTNTVRHAGASHVELGPKQSSRPRRLALVAVQGSRREWETVL
jgi:signal transduction histidine kinase